MIVLLDERRMIAGHDCTSIGLLQTSPTWIGQGGS